MGLSVPNSLPTVPSPTQFCPLQASQGPSIARKRAGGRLDFQKCCWWQCLRADTFHHAPLENFRWARRQLLTVRFPDFLSLGTTPSGTLWSLLSSVIPTLCIFPSGLSSYCASGTPVQGCQVSLLLLQPSWKSQGVCLLCWAIQSSVWLSPVNSVTFYLWRKFNNWATQVPYLWRKFKSLRCAFPELLALPLINSPTPVSILAFSIGGASYLPTRVEWSHF